jgi:hypothetical protein
LRPRVTSCRSWLKPVTAEVEETLVGPIAARQEENKQQERAVDTWAVEEVGAEEEEEDKGWRGVGRDEEEWQPAATKS